VTRYHALTYPKLYIVSQASRHLGTANFLIIFWKSIYQAVIIFVLGCLLFENSFLKVVTISFSALVFTELLNIFTLVDRLNTFILSANILSLVLYVVSIVFFREYLGVQRVDWDILKKVIIITLACWVPFEVIKQVNKFCFPSASDKIMMNVRKKDRRYNMKESGDMYSDLLTPPDTNA
jgi:phospholipid-translocating ATPase